MTGDNSAWGYQVMSPKFPVPRKSTLRLYMKVEEEQGAVGIGILDQKDFWLVHPRTDGKDITFETDGNEAILIVIANNQTEDKQIPTKFRAQKPQLFTIKRGGSLFSISRNLLREEKERLERFLGRQVTGIRQHWLNLPGDAYQSLHEIQQAGFMVDSTLGWNGEVGFRCGIARPYPIVFDDGNRIMEVPMLLMDRPLFADMNLDDDEVFHVGIRLLEEVYSRNRRIFHE